MKFVLNDEAKEFLMIHRGYIFEFKFFPEIE